MFTLHNGDCLQYMKSLPDKVFDLIVTDPPYGLGIAKNPVRQKFERKDWDNDTPDMEVFEQMLRVSKNQVIWGGNYFPLPPNKNFLIWDKIQPEDFSLAMCEMAWTSFDTPAKIFRYSVHRDGANIHPTQKPVALMRWCIAKFAKAGQVVFAPFMGSGTTGVAALELGLSFVGCEIDTEYFEIAEKRITQASLQQGLFNSTNNHIRQNAVTQPTFEGFATKTGS
jgi:DNA modification methylase